jgi:NAD-dependent deacetylase
MNSSQPLALIEKAADLIRSANFAVAFTGAGISTPSGIPDFRSANIGLWMKYDPFEVASLTAFKRRPEKFFNWLLPLARDIVLAKPNPAHLALARLEAAQFIREVITQNIDGLHQQAGSKYPIELHGSMTRLDCLHCHITYSSKRFLDAFLNYGEIPRCERCEGILKPSITLFEEMLPQQAWNQAETACLQADLVLVVGSSLEVTPAAYLPIYALENGARLIINNNTPTHLDDQADVVLRGDVADIIPGITNILCPNQTK